MLRHRGSVLLTIFTFVTQLSSQQLTYSDGWIPMSHDDIYNQLRREATHYPVYLTTTHPIHHDYLNLAENEINARREIRNFKETYEFIDEKPVDSITESDSMKKLKQTIETRKIPRKAKKVWVHDNDVNINNNLAKSDIDGEVKQTSKYDLVNNIVSTAAAAKTYEVTEDTDKALSAEDNTTTEYGYEYKPPTNKPQNLTSTFDQILSKYNINTDDNLQNYDLSLRNKVQNTPRTAYRIPLPYRYNSMDHLPVDPLLAVFLSNYGFYLPSLYGIKANYNNLYGYLASNNIHNNKPFGLYKIFSDTDSWN
uniref:Uncharacterized protein n=1 Tax=Heliothis virescens TaxID=7102 RepID=A0A2A4JSZ7_HELVI